MQEWSQTVLIAIGLLISACVVFSRDNLRITPIMKGE